MNLDSLRIFSHNILSKIKSALQKGRILIIYNYITTSWCFITSTEGVTNIRCEFEL
nr:MAG TPA: hypothetical protein [Caudoviricetes sp.]